MKHAAIHAGFVEVSGGTVSILADTAELAELEDGVDQATLSDAENYVENLQDQIDALAGDDEPTTTTTPSTTSTTEAPDTGTKPAGN